MVKVKYLLKKVLIIINLEELLQKFKDLRIYCLKNKVKC